jgi:putative endonuclease
MFSFFKIQNPTQTPKTLGQLGEEFAQRVYEKRGYKVVAANFFNKKGKRKGEVDFIALGKDLIIFVEVKTRSRLGSKFGRAVESVDFRKQAKLLKAVKIYLLQNSQYARLKPRIDVCVIIVNDHSELVLVESSPSKYVYRNTGDPARFIRTGDNGTLLNPLDKSPFSVKILVNAVEDIG